MKVLPIKSKSNPANDPTFQNRQARRSIRDLNSLLQTTSLLPESKTKKAIERQLNAARLALISLITDGRIP
jgi:hypothetical protein